MVHCSDLCYSTLEHTSQAAAIRLSAACLSAFTMASTKNSPARYEERTSGPAATYLRSKRRFPLRMLSRKSALLARWAASAAGTLKCLLNFEPVHACQVRKGTLQS